MARTTTNYVQTVIKHIKERQHLKLFMLLKEIGAIRRGHEIIRKLALYYPIICRMLHDAERLEACKEHLEEKGRYRSIYSIMDGLNEEFLRATGCDCSEKIYLFSGNPKDLIRHIGHRWFREWVYKHYSEKIREQVLSRMEKIHAMEK